MKLLRPRSFCALSLLALGTASTLSAQADLTIASMLGPSSWVAGRKATFTAVAANSGLVPTPPTTVGFYRSNNATISKADLLIGVQALPALPRSAILAVKHTHTLPVETPTQKDWVGAIVDNSNAVNEFNEKNNTKSMLVQLNAMPQLAITKLTVPQLEATKGYTVRVTVKNEGAKPSGQFKLGLVASANESLRRSSDDHISSLLTTSLAGGASRTFFMTRPSWPANISGAKYVGVIVDIADEVQESVERSDRGVLRNIVPHTGSGAYLGFATPRFEDTNGDVTPSEAFFQTKGVAPIDVVAPALPFHAYVLAWSTSGAPFQIDVMTELGLQLLGSPVLPGHVGHVDALGRASASFMMPSSVKATASIYTHSIWFTPGFGSFVGTGANTLKTRIATEPRRR